MNYITQKQERNRRFTRAVRSELERRRLRRATAAVVDSVLNSPVERGFFVSVDHVLVMDRLRREGKLQPMGSDTRSMWAEIFAAFDAYLTANPSATRTDAAIQVVARGRASRFYLSRRNATKILTDNNLI